MAATFPIRPTCRGSRAGRIEQGRERRECAYGRADHSVVPVQTADHAAAEAETSPDHNEGIDAFFEKRTARWSPLP